MGKLFRDLATGRTTEVVRHEATSHRTARIELIVRNPQGVKLKDHSMVFEGADALGLAEAICSQVAGNVAGVVATEAQQLDWSEGELPPPKPAPRRPSLTLMPGGGR